MEKRKEGKNWRRLRAALLLVAALLLLITAVWNRPRALAPPSATIPVELLGVATFGRGTTFGGTLVGGLSGISYEAATGDYVVVSDDRGRYGPARAYRLRIDLADGRLQDGDVTFTDLLLLEAAQGLPYEAGTLDPEGVASLSPDTLYIVSERDRDNIPPVEPFLDRFDGRGLFRAALPLPDKFLGRDSWHGFRDNLGFESLTATPDQALLVAATENALAQDGPQATLRMSSPVRLLMVDLATGRPGAEFVYLAGPVAAAPLLPFLPARSGLVDLQALDGGENFLALERSYSPGVGQTVRLYAASARHASDVSGLYALRGQAYAPMSRELLFDFADLGLDPDNIEGMTLGPRLPDGRQTLIFVSDNNFSILQQTQFIAVAVDPAALP